MSTPKSLVKSQRLARKRKRKKETRFRRQRNRSGPRDGGFIARSGAPGGVRMSEVLEDFVSPFDQDVEGEEALRRLFTIGMVAWNAALLPESEQQKMVDKTLGKALRKESSETKAIGQEIVDRLIDRKKKYFSRYQRPIINFVLTDNGHNGFHLTVMSAIV